MAHERRGKDKSKDADGGTGPGKGSESNSRVPTEDPVVISGVV